MYCDKWADSQIQPDPLLSPWQVVAMTLLTASGEILECSETVNPELFRAACVHLGCLGIILTITFQCVAEFYLQETTFPSTLKEVNSDASFGKYNLRPF